FAPTEQTLARVSPSLVLFTAAIILQCCGVGAVWTYSERFATQLHFNAGVLGFAIAIGLLCQTAGAFVSAWLSPKLPKWPLILGMSLLLVVTLTIAMATGDPIAFVVAVCALGGLPSALQPFQVAETIALDETRRAAVLIGPLTLLGYGLGPFLASF